MDRVKVGLLGATGLVGQVFVKILSGHPWFELAVVAASPQRSGMKYGEAVSWVVGGEVPDGAADLVLVDPEWENFKDVDIVFSALPSSVAGGIEASMARRGLVVVSNARNYRLDPDVPLLVPEINHGHIGLASRQRETRGWRGLLIKNPNCSTAILVLSLKPLVDSLRVRRIYVTTLQALSGAGYRGGVLSMDIIDNVLPFIRGEEEKIESETLKILGLIEDDRIKPAPFRVSATATRVASLHGHLESVFLEAEDKVGEDDVREIYKGYKWPREVAGLPSAPREPVVVRGEEDRPQPRLDRDAGNGMSVVVGRIKAKEEGVLRYLVLGHNLVRGAAGNAVLIGELYAKWAGLV